MRYHGVDLHKRYATVSVREESGEPMRFIAREPDFRHYVAGLGPEEAVLLEASSGAFRWAERIAERGLGAW